MTAANAALGAALESIAHDIMLISHLRHSSPMSVSYEPKYQIKAPNKAKYQTKHQTTRFLVCCFKHSGLCKGNCII